jgi:phospholipase/lecithinase/hemolysin
MNKLRFPRLGRVGLAAVGLFGALCASGCGGGDLVATFAPGRLLVFGDENSVLTATGAKYSINALNTDNTLLCTNNPIWVQVLANRYGFGFAQCPNPFDTAAPRGIIYAAVGTGVADIAAQITAAAGPGGFQSTDLTTVYTGQKDIIAIYQAMTSAADIGTARAAAEAAGEALANQVNRLADAGARTLIVTVPNVGVTPFALAEKAAHTDFDRADALRQITERFNARLRSTIFNDGRRIGLIQLDEYVGVVLAFPGAYGYANVTQGACTVALPDCTTATLVTGATSTSYLFADDRRVGAAAQQQTGNLAVTRAVNNPF